MGFLVVGHRPDQRLHPDEAVAGVDHALHRRMRGQRHLISSPWMSDFPVFRNEYQQYAALLGEYSEALNILFSQYLAVLGKNWL